MCRVIIIDSLNWTGKSAMICKKTKKELQMNLRKYLTKSQNIKRDSFIWNMTGSVLLAFQSVILLMILTRTVGLVEAGIFTIAYANANLFLNIGKYGMRNFQVSDVKRQFSFKEYLYSRWITTFAMLVVSVVYIIYASMANHYTVEKAMTIFWMCLFKIPDAIEDIYYGDYQKKGRLDIGAKAIAWRLILTIFLFALILVISKDLLIALVISTIFTFIIMSVFIKCTVFDFRETTGRSWKKIGALLRQCFPLAAGAFLSFYIGNAPKYAIDAALNDELQACYGFIAMPVFVIGLLNNFIFVPILYKMSCLWEERKVKKFIQMTFVQVIIIFVITLVCIIGAYLIGVPVLSVLYSTDLSPYKTELLILLLGGGFLGLSGLLNTMITIIRFQNSLLVGYGIIAAAALFLSDYFVQYWEMFGAALLYTMLMAALCIFFVVFFAVGIVKNR